MFVNDPPPTQVPDIEKHPVVILNPTLDVDVAEPDIESPERVVVPKPELDTLIHGAVVEPTQKENASPATELTDSLAAGEEVETPSSPVKLFAPEKVFESAKSVDEANVQVDVA